MKTSVNSIVTADAAPPLDVRRFGRRSFVSNYSSIEPLEQRIAPAFAAVFPLSSLDGLNGFKLSGVAADGLSGFSVSDAGDVNGDGFGDLIIGAFGADPNGSPSAEISEGLLF